jgi:hypothetical protein
MLAVPLHGQVQAPGGSGRRVVGTGEGGGAQGGQQQERRFHEGSVESGGPADPVLRTDNARAAAVLPAQM